MREIVWRYWGDYQMHLDCPGGGLGGKGEEEEGNGRKMEETMTGKEWKMRKEEQKRLVVGTT